MSVGLLFLLLLKASVTSLSGLGSLPVVRNDLVVVRHVLTDRQLNTAVVAARTGPGPYGLYLVCVGYVVAGVPGALAGFLAMIAPAFLVIPLLHWIGGRAGHPRIRGVIRGVVLASVGLLVSSSVPLTIDAIHGWFALAVAAASLVVLTRTRIDSVRVIAAATAAGVATFLLR